MRDCETIIKTEDWNLSKHVPLTLDVGVERHVQHSPAQGVRRGLRARNYEFTHRVDEVLIGE